MNHDFVDKFWKLVDASNSVVITSHMSPDDDSIASVLSMYKIIKDKYDGKVVRIIYSSLPVERYSTFANYDKIEFVDDVGDHLSDCDLFVMLDGNQYSRFSKKISNFPKSSICIDHHASKADEFTLLLQQPKAMATVEIIYETFLKNSKFDAQLAEILLMGLLFDTGSFTFLRPENSNVFDMAKVLLTTANCEIQEFKSRYATTSLRVFSVIQEFMKNSQFIEVSGWPKAMVSFVSSDFKDKEKYLDSEIKWGGLSYLSEYVRNIQDYPWGFIVYPKTAGTGSVSCRSLPRSVNVRDFMERFLGGGGHDRAAGGDFKVIDGKPILPEECIEKLKQWMANNSPVLS